jgi:hypothetical protein
VFDEVLSTMEFGGMYSVWEEGGLKIEELAAE